MNTIILGFWWGDEILDAIQAAWRWVVDVSADMGDVMMNGFITEIPALQGTSLEPYYNILQICNQWVPIDMAILYLGTYFTFIITFIVFKMVLKFVPFIG